MSGLLRFGIKAGILSSAVYFTVDKGVWKDSETTALLYEDVQKTVKPYLKPVVEQIPFEIPELPKSGDLVSTAKTAWNKGVMTTCMFLTQLPQLSGKYLKEGSLYMYEKISDELKALSNVENNEKNETKSLV